MLRRREAWRPLLGGELAEEAWQAILEVAAALKTPGPSSIQRDTRDFGVADGPAGVALFFAYLHQVRPDGAASEIALSYVDEAIDEMATAFTVPGLHSGFTGVGWLVQHLSGRLIDLDDGEDGATQEIDESLLKLLRRSPWRGEYDLISGLVGFGVYALEGFPRPQARECLELLVARLEELAERRPEGLSWRTPPERLVEYQRKLAPKGYYNLGVAHGVPGVIALLGELCAREVQLEQTRSLLQEAVAWLLSQETETGFGSCFPNWVGEGLEPEPSRLAWCYGDPGVAASLLLAARCVGRTDWEREAIRIALLAAARPPEMARIRDTGLCHGAAGLAHLFHRLYQATGEDRLAAAARFWFQRTLDMRRPGEGIAGFLTYRPNEEGDDPWRPERGFLTGAAGIALALLGAVSTVEPDWDRVLLTSIPPRPDG